MSAYFNLGMIPICSQEFQTFEAIFHWLKIIMKTTEQLNKGKTRTANSDPQDRQQVAGGVCCRGQDWPAQRGFSITFQG